MSTLQHHVRRAGAILAATATTIATGGLLAEPAEAADATVTATGRFVYVDDNGSTIGIKHAKVEMCDEDFPGCPLMASGWTDSNGYFTVTGTAGDWFGDLPDPRVKVFADGPAGKVETSPVNFVYCFQSNYHDNAQHGQTINFGSVSPDSGVTCDGLNNQTDNDDGAWQLHNNIREAWDFLNPHTQATSGRNVPKVRVFWPEALNSTFYRPGIPGVDNGGISVAAGRTWDEAVIYHEYGHHVLWSFAESPIPDYNNGNCDGSWFFEAGHCMWLSEKDSIHWTEGFPDFLGEVLSRYYAKDDTISSMYGNIEDLPHPTAHQDPDHFHTEGYTAAVLWDAYDAVRVSEDHDGNGSRDRLATGFRPIWNVVDGFDPKPFDGGWNHVRDIDQFLAGFQAWNPTLASRMAEVYDENHLTGRSVMDLAATTVPAPPAVAVRGTTIPVGDTTRNVGVARVGETSWTRYLLSTDGVRSGDDVHLGWRSVADLTGGGGTSTGQIAAMVPWSITPGRYFVVACADGPGDLFESNEANNCVASSSRVEIRAEQPNLRASQATGLPTAVARGTTLALTDTVNNTGAAVAGASASRFWLSLDTTIGSDVALTGTRSVPTLAAGAGSTGSASVTVPGSVRPGAYHVVSCADAAALVAESIESDNCAVTGATVRVTAPDLRVTELSNPPSRVVRGSRFEVQDVTRNVGGAAATEQTTTSYRLSADARKSAGDFRLVGNRAVPELEAGVSSTGRRLVRVPSTTPVGDYYLIACADESRVVLEGNERNNCRVSTFTVRVRAS
jgi:hypothetical protein